ncbi:hypothetical protein [Pseudidiomarina terrestris]|uniref:Uncharacterized protein n=1 Tax=Pseudidiomarina terrestris TaxID=2820060 RepID=A0AAW7QYC7_9GAMM|nr:MULTISPECIES: hypothetical protein [unclassified Pseudidiomarina]MDN7124073.1 hypothetical protein [Pseudidiomarina sp. 1APP75-32.1]MDN7127145.1 hypothetical protein [Pseudidiomarina sp. 1APR75-33.1]MDN7128330.1 hypothetical protein [Pseudidiomarina sp. 1APR75-15]MDN7135442.1 hypothetical protein [Pseudidiomarina sp. 1ASP75-5]MDN7138526.1 hypothetical protein [Pseudidiomarina sp. 1ASP75-14]
MGLLRSLSDFTKRLGLWFLAAAITLTVLFIAVLIYKLSVFEPEPPSASNCQPLQVQTTTDSEAQLFLYQCQRGNDLGWEGYEVWVHKLVTDEWQRIATSPLAAGCIELAIDERQLTIRHRNSRGDLSIAATSFVYERRGGGANTLSIATERVDKCLLSDQEELPD